MQKGSKEWAKSKQEAREALDQGTYSEYVGARVTDSTVGHVEGPAGTWNTSGVEVPVSAGAVRDVRPETKDAVSLEGLREIGVPVRDESDYGALKVAAKEAEVDTPLETEDRTMQITAARESVEDAEDEQEKAKKASTRSTSSTKKASRRSKSEESK